MRPEPGEDYSETEAVKRKVYLLGLPAGAAMALLLLYLERAQGTLHIVDRVGLPLTSALLIGIWVCLRQRRGRFALLEALLFGGVGLMVMASLSYSALSLSDHSILNLTGLGYWTPVLYALAFLIFGVGAGRTISLGIYLLLLAVCLAEALVSPSNTTTERTILFQLFASNALLLLLLYGFGTLIQAQARQTARYAHDAYTDVLTGLPNRRLQSERLLRELERTSRYGRTFSVVMLDLDYFKDINDTCGHLVGDTILREVATLLSSHIRLPDSAGRWGGEEFLLLLPELSLGEAHSVTERFRQSLEAHTFSQNKKLTASFGVAEVEADEDLDSLIARADSALYQAKTQGRNRVMPPVQGEPVWNEQVAEAI